MAAIDQQTPEQKPQETSPAGWYENPQWPGERYWDGAQWTDYYQQPAWIKVELKGPRASGGGAYAAPGICCACGSPAGAGELVKSNADGGKILSSYTFPLCDHCAAIHEQGRAGLFATHEEKEAWKVRKEEWQRVDDAVRYRFHSTGYKATFSFRNRLFAEAFRELNLNPPKPADPAEELLLRTIKANTKRINSCVRVCAISPDGAWIVSGGDDKLLKVWDARSGEELHTLSGHKQAVMECVVSPDGAWIVSSDLKVLKVWDARSGEELHTLSVPKSFLRGCALSPDRAWVAIGLDKTLRLWDPRDGEELRTVANLDRPLDPCAVGPDGAWILLRGYDTLELWDPRGGEELLTLSGHRKAVNACAVSMDGTRIVSASSDKTLKVWDARSGEELQTLSGHTGKVNCCAVSPNGAWVVSAANDDTIRVWDAGSGAELEKIKTPFAGGALTCAVSPDGSWFASGDVDGKLKIWDAQRFVRR